MMAVLSLGILCFILPGPEGIVDRATLFSRESKLGEEIHIEGVVFDKRVTDGDHLILWMVQRELRYSSPMMLVPPKLPK